CTRDPRPITTSRFDVW
nr:immunoglobulin heavy chain junction region [Macaca mulatta]